MRTKMFDLGCVFIRATHCKVTVEEGALTIKHGHLRIVQPGAPGSDIHVYDHTNIRKLLNACRFALGEPL
jgi:hypothetical protein